MEKVCCFLSFGYLDLWRWGR